MDDSFMTAFVERFREEKKDFHIRFKNLSKQLCAIGSNLADIDERFAEYQTKENMLKQENRPHEKGD